MCLRLGTNGRTNIDFPLPVGPAIILVNECTHSIKWSESYPSWTPKNKSIAAAAATAAYIPLSAAAVYIPQSTAAATHTPRSAAFRLFSYLVFNTTVRTQTWQKTPLEYYTTPRTIKITHQGESPTFDLMTSLPVTSLPVTSHPVAMLLSVMSNGTLCTTTIVRKKGGDALPGMRWVYFR